MKDVLIVSATGLTQLEFETLRPLASSLRQLSFDPRVSSCIVFGNDGASARGLGEIYNEFLTGEYSDHILLFVHDDVYIQDFDLRYRLNDAINRFDVVGLAGNKAPDFCQPSWALKFNEDGTYAGWQDKENLSGAVAHTVEGAAAVSFYGEMPASCELLDGLFLAVNTEALVRANIKFDPQFRFHFYDLDFCRVCRQKGLFLGTWPIAVVHASGGSFGSPPWQEARLLYQKKWP